MAQIVNHTINPQTLQYQVASLQYEKACLEQEIDRLRHKVTVLEEVSGCRYESLPESLEHSILM